MNLILRRNTFAEDGILGTLEVDDGEHVADTLEHSYDSVPKLPAGTYVCKRGTHQLHSGPPFSTFEVMGVPGHQGILFHVGNQNKDSEGCVLLGDRFQDKNYLLNSRITFGHFQDVTDKVNEFSLTVLNEAAGA